MLARTKNVLISLLSVLIISVLMVSSACNIVLASDSRLTKDSTANENKNEEKKKPEKRVVNGVTLVGEVTKEDVRIAEGYKWIAKAFGHTDIRLIGHPNDTILNVEYHVPNLKKPEAWYQLVSLSITKTPFSLSERNALMNGQANSILLFIDELNKIGHKAEIKAIKVFETEKRVDVKPPASMVLINYYVGDEEVIGFMMPFAKNIITVQFHKRFGSKIVQEEKDMMVKIFKHLANLSEQEDIKIYEKNKEAAKKQEEQLDSVIEFESEKDKNQEVKEEVEKEE